MNKEVEKAFEGIKFLCRPDKDKRFPEFDSIFSLFFGGVTEKENTFVGGINDDRNTLHENLFQVMFPDLKPQVHFGTGKGGYEKYSSKRYTADFYDEKNDVIYEIDGNNHKEEIQMLKDRIRDYFFYHELGIRTIRFTNDEVEEMVVRRLRLLYKEGVLDDFKSSNN